jgi:hypothetical protein
MVTINSLSYSLPCYSVDWDQEQCALERELEWGRVERCLWVLN